MMPHNIVAVDMYQFQLQLHEYILDHDAVRSIQDPKDLRMAWAYEMTA